MQHETHELPAMSTASHTHSTYDAGHIGAGVGDGVLTLGSVNQLLSDPWQNETSEYQRRTAFAGVTKQIEKMRQNQPENKMPNRTMRVVQVFIIDPDEKLPLDKAVLYQGKPELTDKTDQELFFDLDMKQLLADHNVARIAVVDKKSVAATVQFLEPARIRDLKMSVVNLATF
jgi:hypothetical protein